MTTALALLSGGLDSLLAARVVRDLGVEVTGVIFDSGFFSLEPPGQRKGADGAPHPLLARVEAAAAAAGIPVELHDISEAFLEMLLHPPHGYGAHRNPCIDCKILFLRAARARLEQLGHGFLITGEVLGQRPMSQNAQALRLIEREAGCQDILLRPLSAQLLPPTRPEREGLVDRSRLYAFSGRTRKPQLELAARLGITDYSQPAGGCVLTDEHFSRRLADWQEHLPTGTLLRFADVVRLRLGRHFRLPGHGKLMIGRNEKENETLLRYRGDLALIRVLDQPGPLALVDENQDDAARDFALRAVARYADPAPGRAAVRLAWEAGGTETIYEVAPAADAELEKYRL